MLDDCRLDLYEIQILFEPFLLGMKADLVSTAKRTCFVGRKTIVFVRRDRGPENYRVRDTSRPKPYPPSFLAELPRFENSRNVEMTSSGKFARGVYDGF